MNYTIILALAVTGLLIWVVATISQIRSDNIRMNAILNKIAKQVGVPDTITDELKNLISEDKKIEAIKKYRIATGCGLVEAKEYVDSLSEGKL
jgi:ribosomal protein L7/L12